jgi:integrase/recombinase XerD
VADRIPTLVPRDAIERRVTKLWRASGLVDGSIATYLVWVRLFRNRFPTASPAAHEHLTCAAVTAFSRSYAGHRRGCYNVKASTRRVARTALRAWWCALHLLGEPVPAWSRPVSPLQRSPLLTAYEEYRREHRGVAAATLVRDMDVASSFVKSLRVRGRGLAGARVVDIDRFVDQLSPRLCRRTIADSCSSLRAFLRFLYATGRLRHDLASCVLAPRYRTDEGPPRALPWETVRRILRVIERDRTIGRRDFAMLLLMASYGLGSSEIVHLRVDDVDWRAGVLRVRRRKTCVPLDLPLLPAIGRALAVYLRRGRPAATKAREIFVTLTLPHGALTTSVIRHRIREYARRAGVAVAVLGGHAFRHSHATRQIDSGAPPKIVGDILGHLRPASTSVYVRVAFQRLRTVALPVPR